MAVTERAARRLCWALAAIDLALGGAAALLPATYLRLVHPQLAPEHYPIDWAVRTGVLWIALMVLEVTAARSAMAARWFFTIAILRLMEVPADVVYGWLARGASDASRVAIFVAPVVNAVAGAYLLAASALNQKPPRPPTRPGT